MMNTKAQAYLRTKVMTASPVELRLMLIDGAIRFAEQCRMGLKERDYEQAYEGSRQCRAILTELLSSLSSEADPLLCERLTSLYTFLISQLMAAMSDRDPAVLEETVSLLRYESETWRMLIAKLATETGTGDVAANTTADVTTGAGDSKTSSPGGDGPIGERLHLAG
ncbi:MAG: flagellar export chaperone FliS [Planctomycetaceae bacterium]|nr:flagellar export chaperone FliS [Planctomycetaceae bacterium]